MRNLLTTTAMTLALGMANIAVASVTFNEIGSSYDLQITLAADGTSQASLTVETENFYRGDFLSASKEKLKGLTELDLYTGMGAAEVPTARWVT